MHACTSTPCPAPRATAIARRGGSDSLPRVFGGDFAAARRLCSRAHAEGGSSWWADWTVRLSLLCEPSQGWAAGRQAACRCTMHRPVRPRGPHAADFGALCDRVLLPQGCGSSDEQRGKSSRGARHRAVYYSYSVGSRSFCCRAQPILETAMRSRSRVV